MDQNLVKANNMEAFLQTVNMDIAKSDAPSDLLPEEVAAGGSVESLNMSKLFKYRLVLGSGDTATFAIKDQADDNADPVWTGNMKDPIRAIILHGYHVYKLTQWMKTNPNADRESLTKEDKNLLAISYDLKSKTRGSFDCVGPDGKRNSAYLDSKPLFDLVKKESRVHFYALFPDIKEVGGEIVFCSFSASGANRFDGLLKDKMRLPKPVLPYYFVDMHHEAKESTVNGKKYRGLTLKFATDKSCQTTDNPSGYVMVADIETLRAKILPLSKQIQQLHQLTIEQTEQGLSIDHDGEKEVTSSTELLDEHGNPIEF